MVSEDPILADGFLRVFRRGPCRSHTPSDCYCRECGEYRSDTPDLPAYSRLHSPSSPTGGAAIYLRTVIVTAAVYRGLDSKRHPEGLTSPLNLPAPGRRQWIYSGLRLRIHLCF